MRTDVASFTLLSIAAIAGCKTANTAADAVKSAGETVASGAGDLAGGAVSLVNVDLSNVLNNLALDLHIDKANIPINAQIPITIAANVCGVNINILSVSGGGSSTCTANSISPELKQYIQQQLAANGSVGGGDQSQIPTNTQTPVTTNTTTNTTQPPQ
jgi:hypothetical protein